MRTYSLLKRLTERYQITLVCYGRPEERALDYRPLHDLCETHIIDRAPSPGTLKSAILSLTSIKPITVRLYDTPAMRAKLAELCKRDRYDVIHLESFYMLPNLPTPYPAPVLLAEPAIEYLAWARHAKVAVPVVQRPALALEALKMRVFEPRAWRKVQAVGAMSSIDEQIMRGVSQSLPVHQTPNGVDEEYFAPDPNVIREPDTALYMGDYKYFPNTDAMLYFVREILPLIHAERPNFTLTLVGKDAPPSLQAIAADPGSGVKIAGLVDDTRPYLQRTGVFICPLRSGSGTRFKLLEAMASGAAVVSTTFGAEGLGAREGEHLLIGDTPAAFARQVLRLCADRELASRLGENSCEWVSGRHSWRYAAENVAQIYERLAGNAV